MNSSQHLDEMVFNFMPLTTFGNLFGIGTYAFVVDGLHLFGESIEKKSSWPIFTLSFLTRFSAKKILRNLHSIAEQLFKKVNDQSSGTPEIMR